MDFRAPFVIAVCVLLGACQSAPGPGASAAPAAAGVVAPETWVRTELCLDLAPFEAEGLGLAAAEGDWREFLDAEVTPRFPGGFVVLDGYGQRRETAGGDIERVRSRVLVIMRPDTPASLASIEAIRAAYLARTGAKTVPTTDMPVSPPRF